MGRHIPEAFIDDLLDRLDIVAVIGERVPLKRAGHEFKALCPFHDEKTPSFTVSPQKQFYHCFGCGKHGSAIGFVMDYDGLEFVDAVKELAQSLGMQVPAGAREPVAADRNKSLLAALEQAAAFYGEQLAGCREALAYVRRRGLEQKSLERFRLGYAPDAWQALGEHLERRGFERGTLVSAGLVIEKKGRSYDRFRERIMFPIHDRRGRVIGFGGRALGDQGPKYVNSPDTPVYHKGRELYGLYQARRRQRPERLLLVEGYLDVITLAQHGFDEPVAASGTALTEHQVRLLFQTANRITCCFDGDDAGRRAAWKALQVMLPHMREGRQADFLFLPEGEDPDSLVRSSPARFREALEQTAPLSELLFRELEKDLDPGSTEGRAALVARARPLLQRIPAGIYRDMLNEQLQQKTRHQVRIPAAAQWQPQPGGRRAAAGSRPRRLEKTPLRQLAALLVQHPSLAGTLDEEDRAVIAAQKNADRVLELIDFCARRPQITTVQLLEHWRGHAAEDLLYRLAGWELLTRDGSAEADEEEHFQQRLQYMMRELLARMQNQLLTARIRMLTNAQQHGQLSQQQKEELRQLLRDKQALQGGHAGNRL